MMLKINIGEHVFKAKLHTEKAPETCRLLTEKMPITGKAIQARWSGEAVWLQMDPYRVEAPQENATSCARSQRERDTDTIWVRYIREQVRVVTGKSLCYHREGVELLEKMGETVLWKGAQDIKLEV